MSDTVIKAEHLSKYYRLGVINNGTLFRDIQTWFALKLGKEDPNGKIGSHRFDSTKEGFWALKDLNFDIKQGDRVGIIGKNGAGKSTLLKVLSRITAPTEGKVKIRGRVSSLLEVGTGFHGELTGRENVYLNGAILGMKKREVDQKMDEIIAFSEIEQYIDTPVKRYSSGMYVRLAFAVAAHLDSEILIADEVLAVGDASFQKKALGKMNDLSTGQGRTILFVSHNMAQVKKLCARGIILDHGTKILDTNISDALAYYSGSIDEHIVRDKLEYPFQDEFLPFNVLSFKSFSISNENGICDYTIYEEKNNKYFVSITFELKEKKDNLVLFYSIFKNETNIYTTDIFASGDIKPSDLKIGLNTVRIELPLNLLTSGEYYLSISAVLHYQGWILENDLKRLYFNLEKKNPKHIVYEENNHPMLGNSSRPGYISLINKTELLK